MDDYNAITAAHYAAYRPSLHGPILKHLLSAPVLDGLGLDVGCGTGQSAVALSEYCRYVFAIDPSAAMLALAPDHPSVEFRQQTKAPLAHQVPGSRFDLVSFAGSLFYQNTAEVVINFPRLLAPEATVVVYDFDVDFNPIFNLLGFTPPASNYNHQCGFEAYLGHGLSLEKEWTGVLQFSASTVELAHLICSVSSWREELLKGGSFEHLVSKIEALFPGSEIELRAECFGEVYGYKR